MRSRNVTIWMMLVVGSLLAFCGGAEASLVDGLVAYYPFNGNANDESGGGHHGTMEGATLVADRFGNSNSAYSFDGQNDRIVIGDVELITGNTMSLQAWFKTTSTLGGSGQYISPIVSKLWNGVSYSIGGTLDADDKIEFVVTGDGRAISNIELNDDVWHHIVGVYDGTLVSDNVKLYVDGVLQSATANNTIDIADTGNFLAIGAYVKSTGQSFYPNDFFGGTIDDVRIYDRALSQTEVTQLYVPEPTTLLLLGLGAVLLHRVGNYKKTGYYLLGYRDNAYGK